MTLNLSQMRQQIKSAPLTADEELEALLVELTERPAETPAPAAAALTDAAGIALDLLAQHPQLDGWAQRGLALVESGDFDPTRYDTRIVIETGHIECDCPARAPRINAGNALRIDTFFNGNGCKHAIALYIRAVLDHAAVSAGSSGPATPTTPSPATAESATRT